jgi:hypothetical protein
MLFYGAQYPGTYKQQEIIFQYNVIAAGTGDIIIGLIRGNSCPHFFK